MSFANASLYRLRVFKPLCSKLYFYMPSAWGLGRDFRDKSGWLYMVKVIGVAGESMWMVRMKAVEMTSLLVEMASFLVEKTSLYEEMAPFQMLSPLRERFFTFVQLQLRLRLKCQSGSGRSALCQNFGGRVEGKWDFWYNICK